MYTGHLDVNLDNIYSVLLATHLLHMPGALEQCRAALLRLRTPPAIPVQQTGQGNVLRPVPNRLVGPPLCWPQTSLYGPGPIISRLPSLHLPPTIIPPLLQDNPGSSLSYRFAVENFQFQHIIAFEILILWQFFIFVFLVQEKDHCHQNHRHRVLAVLNLDHVHVPDH